MSVDLEKAQVMFKLARKGNWNHSYDRSEHFKRFGNLKEIVKELGQKGWLIIHKKPGFEAYSLDSRYKKEITEFMVIQMPHLKGLIK